MQRCRGPGRRCRTRRASGRAPVRPRNARTSASSEGEPRRGQAAPRAAGERGSRAALEQRELRLGAADVAREDHAPHPRGGEPAPAAGRASGRAAGRMRRAPAGCRAACAHNVHPAWPHGSGGEHDDERRARTFARRAAALRAPPACCPRSGSRGSERLQALDACCSWAPGGLGSPARALPGGRGRRHARHRGLRPSWTRATCSARSRTAPRRSGRPKLDSMRERLADLNPHVEVDAARGAARPRQRARDPRATTTWWSTAPTTFRRATW